MLKSIFISCILFSCTATFAQYSRQTDSLALVKMYQTTDGANWKNKQNWLQTSIDKWHGIKLQPITGRVLEVHLYNNNLKGELPDELATLDSAKSIVLANNELYGNIPLLNNIPFYKNYLVAPDSKSFYFMKYQDFAFSGNRYEYADVEKDTSIQKRSLIQDVILPVSAYSRILDSKPFGIDISKRLAQGSSFVLSFPYKATVQALDFQWYLEQNGNTRLIATTSDPSYTLASFDSATHSGTWYCSIKRRNGTIGNYTPAQFSNSFKLAGLANKKPVIQFLENGNSANKQLREVNQEFGNITLSGMDDLFAFNIQYQVIHAPKEVQYLIDGKQVITFLGFEKYEIYFKRIKSGWIGKDSLVLEAKDAEGASIKAIYYFESVLPPSPLPMIDPNGIRYKSSNAGTMVYFSNQKWVKRLMTEITYFEEDNFSCNSKDPVLTTLAFAPFKDSLFLPQVKPVSGKDVSFQVNFTFENETGTASQDIGLVFSDSSVGKISSGFVEFKTDSLNYYLTAKAKKVFGSCGDDFEIHQFVKGKRISLKTIFTVSGEEYYDLRPDIQYCFVATAGAGRFASDTFFVKLPRNSQYTPRIKTGLNWAIQCKKRINKAGFLENYVPPLKWEISSTTHFEVIDQGDYFTITPLGTLPNNSENIPIKITDGEGFVIDTFAVATINTSNSRVKFSTDTARISILNQWTPINLLAYVVDQETPDSLMEISVVRKGKLILKDAKFKTEILPGKGLSGLDTLSIYVKDEGCAGALMSFIISFDTIGLANKAPYFEDSIWMDKFLMERYNTDGYLAVEDTNAFPIVIDIKQYIKDDQEMGLLNFSLKEVNSVGQTLEAGISLSRVLDIKVTNGVLEIKPKTGQFYGKPYKAGSEFFITSFFPNINLVVSAIDKFGFEGFSAPINIKFGNKNHDITYKDTLLNSCPEETLKMNVRTLLERWNPKKIIPLFTLEKSSGNFEHTIQDVTILANQRARIFDKESGEVAFFINFSTPNYYDFTERKIYVRQQIIANPNCNEAPILSSIVPQKLLQGQTLSLNFWDKVQDEQSAKDLFLSFESGGNLNFTYNYATGILEVSAKQLDWQGVDTIFVTVQDYDGAQGRVAIPFVIEDPNGIEETVLACKFSFYPNPVSDILTITSCAKQGTIRMINLLGQEKLTQKITNSGEQQVNVDELESGVYILFVDGNRKKESWKVMVR